MVSSRWFIESLLFFCYLLADLHHELRFKKKKKVYGGGVLSFAHDRMFLIHFHGK